MRRLALLPHVFAASCVAHSPPAPSTPPVVVANDNRTPAGTLHDGVLSLDLDVFAPRKVLHQDSDEDELIHPGNGHKLPVHMWCRSPEPLEPRSLVAVPIRRGLVIRQHGKECDDYVLQVGLKGWPPFAARQSVTSICQLVTHGGRDGVSSCHIRTVHARVQQ